jgi:O-antigen ligase
MTGVGAVALLVLFNAVLPGYRAIFTRPVSIYTADLVATGLLVAALARAYRGDLICRRSVLILISLFGLLGAISFVRGISLFGIQQAGNSYRWDYYFLCAIAYGLTVSLRDFNRALLAWRLALYGLLLVAFLRWLGIGVEEWAGVSGATGFYMVRVLTADQALVLVQSLLVALVLWSGQGLYSTWGILVVSVALAIVALQSRTDWVAAAVGLLVLYVMSDGRVRTRVMLLLAISAVGSMVILVALEVKDIPVLSTLRTSMTEPFDPDQSTMNWRIEGWRALYEQERPALDVLIGQPHGTGFSRTVFESNVEVSPHSYYVRTALCEGIVGLVSLLLVYAIGLRRLLSAANWRGAGGKAVALCLALLVTQLLFYVTYEPTIEQGLVLGLVLRHLPAASLSAPLIHEGYG